MASLIIPIKHLKNYCQDFSNSFRKLKRKGTLPNPLQKSSIIHIQKTGKDTTSKGYCNIYDENICRSFQQKLVNEIKQNSTWPSSVIYPLMQA